MNRQLAAIMFADISGYTALMQKDESMAMILRGKLQHKLETEIKVHGGRIIEFKGDGVLCCFVSTIESVKAALAIQKEMQTEPVVPLRIGIHTGDVMVDDNTIYGDGVNVASRLESFAVPGSIFLSSKAHDDIKNQKDIRTLSLGKFLFKNVKDEIEIFAVSNPGIKIPDPESLTGKGEKSKEKFVLVLPFINMSNEADQEFFSDGLTEELISNLSRLKSIRVVSRTTSMQYKGSNKDLRTIGAETNADYIVEGSVRRQGNNLRITAQFIDSKSDAHLWADNYRGTMDDIFDIQEKVSEKIVDALRIRFEDDEKEYFQKRFTKDTEAYQLYLQGRFFWNRRNEDSLKTAEKFFLRAISKDKNYALAWAGLADTYSLMGEYTNISRRELYERQKEAINRALEIDDRLAEAHISSAIFLMLNDWNWADAIREFRIGLELNPNYATGRHWYAELLMFLGFGEEALREIELSVNLDPVSPGILKDKGIILYYNRKYQEAIEAAKDTLELDPGFFPVYRLLSLGYQALGMIDEAIANNQRWGELTGNNIKTKVAHIHILAYAGRKDEALKLLKEIKDDQLSSNDYRGMALIHTALGNIDETFEWLDESFKRHEESLCSIKVDPKFDVIKMKPRYFELLKKLNMDS